MPTNLALVLASCCLSLALSAMAAELQRVLVLYSDDRLLPANLEAERGLRETISSSAELSAEFLGYPRFAGEAYADAMTRFLREKYALWPPDVLVAGGDEALVFLLRHRAELFPQTPIVHMGVDESLLRSLTPPLPPEVVGIPIACDFSGTIDLALRWHAQARRQGSVFHVELPAARSAEKLPAEMA